MLSQSTQIWCANYFQCPPRFFFYRTLGGFSIFLLLKSFYLIVFIQIILFWESAFSPSSLLHFCSLVLYSSVRSHTQGWKLNGLWGELSFITHNIPEPGHINSNSPTHTRPSWVQWCVEAVLEKTHPKRSHVSCDHFHRTSNMEHWKIISAAQRSAHRDPELLRGMGLRHSAFSI